MKNCIEIEFTYGMYKAFWNREQRIKVNGYYYIRYYSRFIFPANTKEQAEQRAKDFIAGTGEFNRPRTYIRGYVFV